MCACVCVCVCVHVCACVCVYSGYTNHNPNLLVAVLSLNSFSVNLYLMLHTLCMMHSSKSLIQVIFGFKFGLEFFFHVYCPMFIRSFVSSVIPVLNTGTQ